jgi:molybdate transport system ATP-binding protein
MSCVLFQFQHVSIYRGPHCIVRNFNKSVQQGTCVAVTGCNGSGKTSLLKAIAGKIPIAHGQIQYFSDGQLPAREAPCAHQLGWVDFHAGELVMRHSDAFYQQRYYASQTHGWVKVYALLYGYATQHFKMQESELLQRLDRLCNQKHLFPYELLERQVQQLSNGELKKLLILRALLPGPKLLLLNAPFTGLDAASRRQMKNMLRHLKAQGITIVMEVLAEEMDDLFDDVITLQKGYHPSMRPHVDLPLPVLSRPLSRNMPLFEMRDVQVQYTQQQVLKHISWQVYPGERWLICGQNGSGKSTLLSLVTADHPQAYAQQVYWRVTRRGSGESIWEIKRQQAYVSPEMHHYFRTQQDCLTWLTQQVKDHFFNTGLGLTIEQEALRYLQYWDMVSCVHQPVSQLSTSEQRLLLFIRALLMKASLLILDELCQGFDELNRQRVSDVLTSLCANPSFTLLYVTHELQEVPAGITHMLYLHRGEIAYCGRYDQHLAEDFFTRQVLA